MGASTDGVPLSVVGIAASGDVTGAPPLPPLPPLPEPALPPWGLPLTPPDPGGATTVPPLPPELEPEVPPEEVPLRPPVRVPPVPATGSDVGGRSAEEQAENTVPVARSNTDTRSIRLSRFIRSSSKH